MGQDATQWLCNVGEIDGIKSPTQECYGASKSGFSCTGDSAMKFWMPVILFYRSMMLSSLLHRSLCTFFCKARRSMVHSWRQGSLVEASPSSSSVVSPVTTNGFGGGLGDGIKAALALAAVGGRYCQLLAVDPWTLPAPATSFALTQLA